MSRSALPSSANARSDSRTATVSSPSCASQARAASRYVLPTIRSWVSHHRVGEEHLPLDGADRENREAAVIRELAEPVGKVTLSLPAQPRDPIRRDRVKEAFRNIEAPEVLEAVQQPVGVGGIAARLELPEPDEPRHAGVGRLFEQMHLSSPPNGRPWRSRLVRAVQAGTGTTSRWSGAEEVDELVQRHAVGILPDQEGEKARAAALKPEGCQRSLRTDGNWTGRRPQHVRGHDSASSDKEPV